MTYWDAIGNRADWFIIVIGLLLLLAVIDLRLSRMFRSHEAREMKNYASLAMTAESAAAAVGQVLVKLREMEEKSVVTRDEIQRLAGDVRMHDRRLGALEERYMRAALTVPVVKPIKRDEEP